MILSIDAQREQPIYEQLRDQIVRGIASGDIAPGEPLPSVRRLAADLGINLHTVNKAYNLLCAEGYMVMDRRKGATAAQHIPSDQAAMNRLSNALSLAAAEARCRGVEEAEFLVLCRRCYIDTGEVKTR